MDVRETAKNGAFGAIVSLAVIFAPLRMGMASTLLGGLLAGYLEGGSDGDRLLVGVSVGFLTFLLVTAIFLPFYAAFRRSPAGPISAIYVHVVIALSQLPAYVVFSVCAIPAAGAWIGGLVRSSVNER